MSVKRYSGDVELRIELRNGSYYASLRAPKQHFRGILNVRDALALTPYLRPSSSAAMDEVALSFIQWTEREHGRLPVEEDENGNLVVRRQFISPCPVRVA